MAREQLGAAPSIAAHATTKNYTDTTFTQKVTTILTAPTTLPAAANTFYDVICSYSSTDANFGDTIALLHGENFVDASMNASRSWVTDGGVSISTAQKKFGTSSFLFNQAKTARLVPDASFTAVYNPGIYDFTIELWVYPTVQGNALFDYRIDSQGSTDPAYMTCYIGASNFLRVYVNGADRIVGGALTLNTWTHVAVCRSGTNTRLFLNGTQSGSTYTGDTNNYQGKLQFGTSGFASDAGGFAGYMDEIRVTKAARYTANFTAPTAAFPDATFGVPTLPTAVGNTSVYEIRNALGESGYITLGTTSGQTIDGLSNLDSRIYYIAGNGSIRVVSDGSNWRQMRTSTRWPADALTPTHLFNKLLVSPMLSEIRNGDNRQVINFFGGNSTSAPAGTTNVAINQTGNTDANARLQVSNERHGAIFTCSDAASGYFPLYASRTGSAGPMMGFYVGATNTGNITSTASAVTYGSSSDYRLKTDVQPLDSGLDTIGALNPVTYKWKVDNSYGEGFIAHELQDVIPQAVSGEKDAELEDGTIVPQNVDMSRVVPHLVAAVQELKAELDAAKARIAQLEAGAQ